MIYQTGDTICAISTPHGSGGIAVIRVSGPDAVKIVDSLWKGHSLDDAATHTAHYGEIFDPERPDTPVDQCVVTIFRGPRSYTGEDVVEISVHGSVWIQREMVRLLVAHGCRPAERGEFTRRALMNGRMDLTQAEGIADVIASSSRAAHRIAMSQMKGSISRRLSDLRDSLINISSLLELELDFSEEDVEFADRSRLVSLAGEILVELKRLHSSFSDGRAIKEGIPVVIAGATNAGKSSLLNALLNDDRAIVSDIHGTTRDTIEETIEIGDYLFRFIDTAGLRDTSDEIEKIGIRRSHDAISRARLLLLVIDATAGLSARHLDPLSITANADDGAIIAINKTDVADEDSIRSLIDSLRSTTGDKYPIVEISAKTGQNIDRLTGMLLKKAESFCSNGSDGTITNLRQALALEESVESTQRLMEALQSDLPTDLVAQHLRDTLTNLSTITGTITSTEILNTIFTRFCVGK